MLTKPRWLLHLEGASILGLALYSYHAAHYRWWLFALLFLSPDLFMLGYLKDAKWGAIAYNLVHTLAGPILLLVIALLLPGAAWIPYALIWLAHIGFDRMLGYGLKYPTYFKDTHLQHV
ncbi:MAG TPA: DUF4260 domain-containing protein [Verrucomicrobiae bacterium]|nr:DUF4260 domain-containing protein [Verrucomicrobiae bacterium]